YDPEFRTEATDIDHDDVTIHNVILSIGDLKLSGTVGFALVKQTANVDRDGNGTPDLMNAGVLSLALNVDGAGVHIDGLAHLTVTGQLALASITESGQTTARYTALKMGNVTVSGNINLPIELNAEITVSALNVNQAAVGFSRLDWN